jgi:hypothetical protein
VHSIVIQFHVINFLILRGNCTTTIISVFSYKVFRVINKVSRKSCRPERDEVNRGVHRGERYDLYSSPNIIWVIISKITVWVGHVAHTGRGAYRVLLGKPEGERSFGRIGVPG